MRGIVGTLAAIAAFSLCVAGAQATVVYNKGQKIYTAGNSGKGAKQVATGEAARITQDGQYVIYTNSTDTLLKVPVAGGATAAFGGSATWCVKCAVFPSPDGKSLLLFGEKGELDYVPIDGAGPTRLSAGISSYATYSPDSKQVAFDQDSTDTTSIFTTPVAGGVPTRLNLAFGSTPVWTTAGIVVSTVSFTGKKAQFKLVLLDGAGNVTRVLQRTAASAKTIKSGIGIQDAAFPAGANVVTFALGKKSKTIARLVSATTGKVKAKLTFSKNELVAAANPAGNTLLVIGRKGRLQAVNFKSGKRKTLVKSGVDSADISR